MIKSVTGRGRTSASTRYNVRVTERSDTLIAVWIIEGLYYGDLDNRGSNTEVGYHLSNANHIFFPIFSSRII